MRIELTEDFALVIEGAKVLAQNLSETEQRAQHVNACVYKDHTGFYLTCTVSDCANNSTLFTYSNGWLIDW